MIRTIFATLLGICFLFLFIINACSVNSLDPNQCGRPIIPVLLGAVALVGVLGGFDRFFNKYSKPVSKKTEYINLGILLLVGFGMCWFIANL
jgi:hypothetical protein